MKKLFVLMIAASLMAACGQSNDSKDSETNAEELTEGDVTDGVYQVSSAESTVKWHGEKITGKTHDGTIAVKFGSVHVSENALKGGEFVLDMTTITEINQPSEEYKQKLIGHLKSDDFFNVDSFPTASFAIRTVTGDSAIGDLTIKGITHSITVPYSYGIEDDQITARSSFSIDRSKWNIKYGSGSFFEDLGDNLIYDEVKFNVEIKANKQ